ncbi:hypothetical protein [Parafrankia sp. FMc2]|uniref:hypothetical protein n=1 Tax=Parafrankia sp. FMc2 TaxID=3233196 RepID=UPI0034D40F31
MSRAANDEGPRARRRIPPTPQLPPTSSPYEGWPAEAPLRSRPQRHSLGEVLELRPRSESFKELVHRYGFLWLLLFSVTQVFPVPGFGVKIELAVAGGTFLLAILLAWRKFLNERVIVNDENFVHISWRAKEVRVPWVDVASAVIVDTGTIMRTRKRLVLPRYSAAPAPCVSTTLLDVDHLCRVLHYLGIPVFQPPGRTKIREIRRRIPNVRLPCVRAHRREIVLGLVVLLVIHILVGVVFS